MRSALPDDFEPPVVQETQWVSLANLQSINVCGTLQASVYLLLWISLPVNPRITLEIRDHPATLEDNDKLFITRLPEVCRIFRRNKSVRKYKEVSLSVEDDSVVVKMGDAGFSTDSTARNFAKDVSKQWGVQLVLPDPAFAVI